MEYLKINNQGMKNMELATAPRWMCSEADRASKKLASVVVASTKQEDADEVLRRSSVFILGRVCRVAPYVEISPIRHCERCYKLDRPTRACMRKPACRICAQAHHRCDTCGAHAECQHTDPKCINCGGDHTADAKVCIVRAEYKHLTIRSAPRRLGEVCKRPSKKSYKKLMESISPRDKTMGTENMATAASQRGESHHMESANRFSLLQDDEPDSPITQGRNAAEAPFNPMRSSELRPMISAIMAGAAEANMRRA